MKDVLRPMNSLCHLCIAITYVSWSKGILCGIPWQLIRHSVIPYMVVLEEELWIEMNMFLNICLLLCVCTGWGGIAPSCFVEICIIVTNIGSFPHKRIIFQCSLLLWFFHLPCKWYMEYVFLLPLLRLILWIVLVKRKWVDVIYGICPQRIETFSELCHWFVSASSDFALCHSSRIFQIGVVPSPWVPD